MIAGLCGSYSCEPDDHCHGVPATDDFFFVVSVGEGEGGRGEGGKGRGNKHTNRYVGMHINS